MTALTEAPAETGAELAIHQGNVIDEYRPRIVMAAEEARALDESLRAMMQAVLREDVDYGVIPGTGTKPSLLKPGAEKLLQWFGFGHTAEVTETERDAGGGWQGVTYRCTVTKSMQDGRTVVVAMCEGYAGYDEDRFFMTAEGARRKAEEKERANARRYERNVNPAKWETVTSDYRAPRNSVMKMAQKRALVGAALQATSASTLFTQDVEDNAPAAEAAGPPIVATAKAVVMALPQDVRTELDRWFRGQGWGPPGTWDAEQWCAALVQAGLVQAVRAEAGRQSAGPAEAPPAQQAASTLPDGDPWALRVEEVATLDDAQAVGGEITDAISAGTLDETKARAVFDALAAREDALRKVDAA